MRLTKLSVIIFFTSIFILFLHPVDADGDFFHHMNTGRFLLIHHFLPQRDDFTFTATNKTWVSYAWGAGVIYYLIFDSFKYVGISLLVSLLATLTLFLLYFLLLNYSIPKRYALLWVLLALGPISIRWPNRPEIFTYPLIIVLLLIDKLKQKRPNLVLFYPLIILAWANLYGASVILGLGLLAGFLIKDFILYRGNIRKIVILTTFLSIFFSYFNGYGLKTILFIFNIPPIASYDLEWQGIFKILSSVSYDQLLDIQYRVLIYFIYFTVFLLIVFISVKKIFKQSWLLLLSVAILAPFFFYRYIPLAVMFSIPLLAYGLNLQIRFKTFFTMLILISSFVSIGISLWIQKPGFGQNEQSYPPKVIDFITINDLRGKVFNNQQLGGFLSFYLYPKVKIFTDTRDDLYLNIDVINDFYKTVPKQRSIIPILKKYQVDLAVVDLSEGQSYQSLFYSDEFVPVFLDNHYLIAVKKQIALDKKLSILDIIDPFSPSSAKQGQEKQALILYQSILKLDSFNNLMRLAGSYLANNQPDQTINLVSKLQEGIGPRGVLFAIDKHTLLSRAYLVQNDCSKAKYFIDLVKKEAQGKFIFDPKRVLPYATELDSLFGKSCSLQNRKIHF